MHSLHINTPHRSLPASRPTAVPPASTMEQKEDSRQQQKSLPASDPEGSHMSGIDMKAAMSILSSRADAGGDKGLREKVPDKVAEERRSMGQSIDAFQWTNMADGCGCGQAGDSNRSRDAASQSQSGKNDSAADEAVEVQRKALDDQRTKNEAELRSKLEEMSVGDMISATFKAQEERTIAYREYDRGLDMVLSTGNITNYPAVVASATASFSVLSDTINAIRMVLSEKHGRKDLAGLICALQKSEKEKLNTTAALHLERIREQNEAVGVEVREDDRIRNLLRDGVVTLQAKVAELVEAINDTLEELRYAAAEEE